MRAFSQLLDDLVYTRSRNAKLRLIGDYLKDTPDPDRGLALAALTGTLDIPHVKPAQIRGVAEERIDPVLLSMSRDYVGDMAETMSLLWPAAGRRAAGARRRHRRLSDAVERLRAAEHGRAAVLAGCSTISTPSGRFALLKLATGALRVGISARLAKQALADAFGLDVEAVEEVWHGLKPPYRRAVRLGRGPRPSSRRRATFRCSARSCSPTRSRTCGQRSTIMPPSGNGTGSASSSSMPAARPALQPHRRRHQRHSFPDVAEAFASPGVLDGELLVRGEAQGAEAHGGAAASFNALQQRLGRKNVSEDARPSIRPSSGSTTSLFDGDEDLRALPWSERRPARALRRRARPEPLRPVAADRGRQFRGARGDPRRRPRRGDRGDDAQAPRQPLCRRPPDRAVVQMEARPAHRRLRADVRPARVGKRSSYYSDYTFGCWTEDGELLPVGKAYFGFTDEELKWLDRCVRNHTVSASARSARSRRGWCSKSRSIRSTSKRHKSGLAMRFPRISRIRTDKPAAEGDPTRIGDAEAMVTWAAGKRPPGLRRTGAFLPSLRNVSGLAYRWLQVHRRGTCRDGRPRARTRAGRPR